MIRIGRTARLCFTLVATGATSVLRPQAPFDLDPTFSANLDTWNATSVAPLPDGDVLISGRLKFPGDVSFRLSVRLHADGSPDPSYPQGTYAGGKLTAWSGRYYVGNGNGVQRMWPNGDLDTDFIFQNNGVYFTTLQGGDYHVFPDGRILMSGAHILEDTIRGFTGLYNLIWFSNQGYLDTTRIHRKGNGVVYEFEQLYDGKFICTSNCSVFDGQATGGWIFKVDSTGAIDTTFHSGVYWGEAFTFLPLPDGRCYAGGLFKVTGIPDTLQIVRFMPDGSLDPTFNHLLDFRVVDLTGPYGAVVSGIHQLDSGRLIVTGGFETIEGEERQGICMIDTAGNLIDDYFTGPGCGDYVYMGITYGSIRDIAQAPDGSWYIFGSFHGYNDGTTNDPGQRMVSRLYGLDVGVGEPVGNGGLQLAVRPNPAIGAVHVQVSGAVPQAQLVVRDALGRVATMQAAFVGENIIDLRSFAPGPYLVVLESQGRILASQKLAIEP